MNANTPGDETGAIIVCEPMSTIPYPTPTTPSKPASSSTLAFPRPVSPSKSEALKANPHPYPIRTTSTGVLSRSNSTATTTNPYQYQYQYYIPQSPASPSKESLQSNDATKNGGGERARGARHRYSKSLNSGPSPLPSLTSTTTRGMFSHGNGSTSSLSSVESDDSPVKSGGEEEVGDVFTAGRLSVGTKAKKKRSRADTMPGVVEVEDCAERRGRSGRALGSAGSRVKGMIESFERSASRSGEDGEGKGEEGQEEGSHVRRGGGYAYRHGRKRTESDVSVSSASSFGSFTTDAVRADNKFESAAEDLKANSSTCLDSTPKRNTNVQNQSTTTRLEEPTMEELISSTFGHAPSSSSSSDDATIKGVPYVDETVKGYNPDVAYSTVTASSVRYDLPMGTSGSQRLNPDDEMSVEELFATLSAHPSSNNGAGASAWERDVGCTVKHVGDAESSSTMKNRLGELFGSGQPDPTSFAIITLEREFKLAQDMAETKEMVRTLSARVAGVEAKIGEMEVAAGELEIMGRELLEQQQQQQQQQDLGDDDEDNEKLSEESQGPTTTLPRVITSLSSTIFGLAQSVVQGDGVCASLAKMVLPSSSSYPPKSRSRSREASPQSRRAAAAAATALPMWYKKSWACYLLFLGLGACAFALREVVRRGLMLRGKRT